jgi:hypothetical protein
LQSFIAAADSLEELSDLNLSGLQLAAVPLDNLFLLTHLRCLDLSFCSMDGISTLSLASLLSKSSSIRKLSLFGAHAAADESNVAFLRTTIQRAISSRGLIVDMQGFNSASITPSVD